MCSDHADRAGQLQAAAAAYVETAATAEATRRTTRKRKLQAPAEAPGSNGEPQYATSVKR